MATIVHINHKPAKIESVTIRMSYDEAYLVGALLSRTNGYVAKALAPEGSSERGDVLYHAIATTALQVRTLNPNNQGIGIVPYLHRVRINEFGCVSFPESCVTVGNVTYSLEEAKRKIEEDAGTIASLKTLLDETNRRLRAMDEARATSAQRALDEVRIHVPASSDIDDNTYEMISPREASRRLRAWKDCIRAREMNIADLRRMNDTQRESIVHLQKQIEALRSTIADMRQHAADIDAIGVINSTPSKPAGA